MIEVEMIERRSKTLVKAEGHAEYAERGKDIVCAGVSILMKALAAEATLRGGKCKFEEGCAVVSYPTRRMRQGTEMFIAGVESLAQEYPEHVKIIRK